MGMTMAKETGKTTPEGDRARGSDGTQRAAARAQSNVTSMCDAEGDEFVAQCRAQAQALGERKQDQEQRLDALIQGSFGQLEQIFNALLETAQEAQSASHVQFEEAAASLEGNLDRHEQVATKLRAIMAILTGASSQQ